MRVPFLDLGRQHHELERELAGALASVLDGGRFVFGPAVERFEKRFAEYCGSAECIGVASGTDAVTIALEAVGVGEGDEVITAANTCVPTIVGIEATGATAVLVDPDPTTFTLDPANLEQAVTRRTRAIVPVHLYGHCAEMAPILAFARDRSLKVVEDAAQAHGAEEGSRRAGSLADAAAFSFYPTKNLGALGDAGAVVTNDPAAAAAARELRNYGERVRYDSVRRGRNSRLDTLQAAVLDAKLDHLETWTDRRRAIASRYIAAFADTPLGLPRERTGSRHVYHLFVVQTADRDGLRARLTEQGVETLVHYPRPIHMQPAYVGLGRAGGLPISKELSDTVLSLPLYPELTDDEVGAVIEAVRASV